MNGKYLYVAERGEWLGMVTEGDTVLDFGCEATEAEIKAWIAKAIENQPWIKGNPPAPDMYDRTKH